MKKDKKIFCRLLGPDEVPLKLALSWSVNFERKSLVLSDHDPNQERYGKLTVQQMESRFERQEKM